MGGEVDGLRRDPRIRLEEVWRCLGGEGSKLEDRIWKGLWITRPKWVWEVHDDEDDLGLVKPDSR